MDTNKIDQLKHINELLHIPQHNHHKIVFVYSAPKVGSTSIVSSLRIFAINKMDIIHIHDEEMLKVLTKNPTLSITINELIQYNANLGKDVYVINVYRSPIERKMSAFFEKIGSFHFNASDAEVSHYPIANVTHRFNHIFPWVSNGDHFMDTYPISIPYAFDISQKYLLVCHQGIKYITLRLLDSPQWGQILTTLFGFPIHTIKDYETSNKPIKDLYQTFKASYKIPRALLDEVVMKDACFAYYYSLDERTRYYNEWLQKSDTTMTEPSYTLEQYKFYETICIENCHIDVVQLDHYFDEGCTCKACNLKRMDTIGKITKGIAITERIAHKEAKQELIHKKINLFHHHQQHRYANPAKIRKPTGKNALSQLVMRK